MKCLGYRLLASHAMVVSEAASLYSILELGLLGSDGTERHRSVRRFPRQFLELTLTLLDPPNVSY